MGNVLEWYDFMVYGYFVPTLKGLFFPTADPLAALIAAYGVLAVSFVMRPVGALMFGHIGDRLGRKRALELSVILMAVPSLLFGFLPTYETIGIAAPIGLFILRLFLLYALGSAFFYVLYLFVQAALVDAGMVAHEAQLATSCALCVLVFALPAAGYASDVFGRRPVMLTGVLATGILVVPLYRMLLSLDFAQVVSAQIALTVLVALVIGPVPSTMAEMFPPRTRFSSMSIGYNGSLAVFGGTALISGAAIWAGRETHRDEFV